MSTYVSSRDPGVFDDPLKFKPERFDPSAPNKVPIYSCFPYSLGPRSCIGQSFAQVRFSDGVTPIAVKPGPLFDCIML